MDVILDQFFNLEIIGDNFDYVLKGFWFTIKLSIVGGVCALTWGLVLALLRQLPGRALAPVRGLGFRGFLRSLPRRTLAPIRGLTIAYIDVFRGLPFLIVLLMIYTGMGALTSEGFLPRWLGIPEWLGQPAPFWYGILALTLTYGAYMAEVYRAGIEAVPGGQTEAARSLGMSHGQSMRHVIVPQAVRKVVPPLLNDFIALTKDTALVSVIGLIEVVQAAADVQAETFNNSAFTLGALMFLAVTIPLARVVDRLIAGQQAKYQRGLAGA